MRNNYVKKGFTSLMVSLTAVLAVASFSSCGKVKEEDNENNEVSGYVYEADYKELGTVNVSDISQACISKDGVYMTAPYYNFDENGIFQSTVNYFMSCPTDSDKIETTKIEDLEEDENIDSFLLDKDNNIVMLTTVSHYNENDGSSEYEYYMINIDSNGKISKRTKLLPDIEEGERFNSGRSGAAYVGDKLLVGSNSKIYTFNEDGSSEKTIEAKSFITCMFTDSNGKIYVMSYKDEESGIFELDTETGKLGKAFNDNGNNISSIEQAKLLNNGNICLNDGRNVFECNFETDKCEIMFNWVNVGVDESNVIDFQPMEDGSIVVLCSEGNMEDGTGIVSSYDVELVIINKKEASEVKQKKKLTLAADDIYISSIKEELFKFNRTNKDYQIEVLDYNSYGDDSANQMNLDIISGNIPDIIEVSYIPKEVYAKKGILTDLYPLMENDDGVKKEDFVDKVRETMEDEGKLYYMPLSFAVNAVTGSKATFGDAEGWTYDEMEEKYNNMPKDGVFMYKMTSDWFIQNIIGMQLGNFIDYDTGEVNLDSKEFVKMLEFSKNFKTQEEYLNSGESSEQFNTYEMIKDNKLLLRGMSILDFADFQIDDMLYESQGGYTILSYPSADKNNKLMMTSLSGVYAISDKCDNKEGAWEFLKTLYEYEFQMNGRKLSGLPVRKDALDKKIEYAMATEEYTDDDGTKVRPVQEDRIVDSFDLSMDLTPYTEEQMDRFRSVIDRIGMSADINMTVQDITGMILEEAKALYAGDKTAEEVAEILQSRVKIYISENF